MDAPEAGRTCRAMLVSLGGSPQPVLYALNQQKPEYILLFVSLQSATEIQGIIQGLAFRCHDFDRIVSPSVGGVVRGKGAL